MSLTRVRRELERARVDDLAAEEGVRVALVPHARHDVLLELPPGGLDHHEGDAHALADLRGDLVELERGAEAEDGVAR